MKKSVLFFLILLQTVAASSQVQIGLKCGYVYLNFFEQAINTPSGYTNTHPSYLISFMLRGRNPGLFNMGGELEYTHRFFHIDATSGGVSGQTHELYDLSADYMRLVIQPQLTFGTGIRFFIYPGIYGGYMFHSTIHGTSEYHGSGTPEPKKYIDGSAGDYMPEWEFGALLGLGVDIPLYKGLTLVLESNGAITIPNIFPNWGDIAIIRILEIQISAGIAYIFPSKKQQK